MEDYVMLGAGALVSPGKVLQSGYLYVGAPAKPIRALNDSEKAFLEYSYQHYIKLKDEYLTSEG
jgi:carbonic anhydrase/acetyltransferase-like protein (isoleucine patch superfamily)